MSEAMQERVGIYVDEEIDPLARVQAETFPDPVRVEPCVGIDTRPVFRLKDFVKVRARNECTICLKHHEFYAHGCQSLALVPAHFDGWDGIEPATADCVPYSIAGACRLNKWEAVDRGVLQMTGRAEDAHRHEDFRWE